MTVSVNTEGKGAMSIAITGVAATTGGGQGSVANPEGVSLIIMDALLYTITESTGSANLSIGVGATATTSATDILNALDMNGVTEPGMYNCFARQNTAKTEKTAPALWTSTTFVTFTASATMVGFTAVLYLKYMRV
jgi:hypothetical protein